MLLAGILKSSGQLGPAEIATKRIFTYRYVRWLAERRGVAFAMPPAHPFNPLPLLRLSVAAGSAPDTVRRLFDFVWREGRLPESDDGRTLDAVAGELGIGAWREVTSLPAVKSALVDNTEAAVKRGVFGVRTFAHENELFWGDDATDMLIDYIDDPGGFRERAGETDTLPIGVARTRLAVVTQGTSRLVQPA